MTTPDSPSLLLQRAAELIEQRAADTERGDLPVIDGTAAWTDWFGTFDPTVAAPLVAWLRAIAANMTRAGIGEDWARAVCPPEARAALDFARLVLGVSAERPEASSA